MEAKQRKTTSRRVLWVDVAKGICIIAIIAGHMGFKDVGGKDILVPAVFQFHVPMFFITAGLFLTERDPISTFISKKASRLLAPYATTCVFMGLFVLLCKLCAGRTHPPTIWNGLRHYVLSATWGSGFKSALLPEGVGYIGAIWYLEALFVALLEVRLLMGLRINEIAMAMVATAMASLALAARWHLLLPFNILPGLVGGAYVLVGLFYRKHVGLEDIKLEIPSILGLCIVFFLCYHGKVYVSLVEPKATHGLLGLLASLCASLLVAVLSQRIARWDGAVRQVLIYFGQNSLWALCVHLCCLDLGFDRLVAWGLGSIGITLAGNALRLANLMLQFLLISFSSVLMKRSRLLFRIFA